MSQQQGGGQQDTLRRREKEKDVRRSNIIAARALADTVRTSLGPKGVSSTVPLLPSLGPDFWLPVSEWTSA